jgi:adenylate kinase family enzyme
MRARAGTISGMQASVGSASSRLVVIRGNSGSGKSTVARELRRRCGRSWALVEQDHLRRIVLWEHDKRGGLAPTFIGHTVGFLLDHGRDVILEGILHTARYQDMLTGLLSAHCGRSHVYYLDASLEETLRRHTTRPQVSQFTGEQMRGWYNPNDVLNVSSEHTIPQTSTVDDTIAYIALTADLSLTPATGML